MATHFRSLSADEKALVRVVQPHRELSTPKHRRYMIRRLGWSETKFANVQRALVDKGWPIKPYGGTIEVNGRQRPLYRLLAEEEDFVVVGKAEKRYNLRRMKTGRNVQRQGERANPTSQPIFDEEQRLSVARNVVEGKRTPVPIGHSENDPEYVHAGNGKVLEEDELAREMATLLKEHPRFR